MLTEIEQTKIVEVILFFSLGLMKLPVKSILVHNSMTLIDRYNITLKLHFQTLQKMIMKSFQDQRLFAKELFTKDC